MRTPFPPDFKMPDVIIIDPATMRAVNVPAALQDPPRWWEQFPDEYESMKAVRAAQGIEIDDFPKWAMPDEKPAKRASRLITARESMERRSTP